MDSRIKYPDKFIRDLIISTIFYSEILSIQFQTWIQVLKGLR